MLLFPFFQTENSDAEYENVVIVDFSSSSSLAGASGSTSTKKVVESPKRETKVAEKISSTPPKKVLTQEDSPLKVPEIKSIPVSAPSDLEEAPVKLEKDTRIAEVNTPSSKIDVPLIEIPMPAKEGGGASVDAGESDMSGADSSAGSTDSGSGNASSGTGKSDSGAAEDNAGNGLFGAIGELKRSVVYRPDVSAMIKESSVIKVRLCISRDGRVVDYLYEPEGSQVSDPSLIDATLDIVSKYRFEKVAYGPILECGIYTIRVDMSKI